MKNRQEAASSLDGPGCSVIVPTRNRAGQLSQCLAALACLEHPPGGYEVIVVDDGGDCSLPEQLPCVLQLRCIRSAGNQGPSAARNLGASHARGRFLAFIDDDCVPAPEWLCGLYAALAERPGTAAGGRILNGQPRNMYAEVNQAILDVVYRYYNSEAENAKFFATMNFAVPRDEFGQLGGFNTAFRTSEDRDFCARWLARGFRLRYIQEAVVTHLATWTFASFWRRHLAFGRGAFTFRTRHTAASSGAVRFEPVSYYRALLAAAAGQRLSAHSLSASALVCLSQLASTLGYLDERRRAQTANGRSA